MQRLLGLTRVLQLLKMHQYELDSEAEYVDLSWGTIWGKKSHFLSYFEISAWGRFECSNRCGIALGCCCEYSEAPRHSRARLGASCDHLSPPATRSELPEARYQVCHGRNLENHDIHWFSLIFDDFWGFASRSRCYALGLLLTRTMPHPPLISLAGM